MSHTLFPPQIYAWVVAILTLVGWYYSYQRVRKSRHKDRHKLSTSKTPQKEPKTSDSYERQPNYHSQPLYYAIYTALMIAIPACGFAIFWLLSEPYVLHHLMLLGLSDAGKALPQSEQLLLLQKIINHNKEILTSQDPQVIEGALRLSRYQSEAFFLGGVLTIIIALMGLLYGLSRIRPRFQARQAVEAWIKGLMLLSAALAVFTTIGIVLSLFVEAWQFFRIISPIEFLFGTEWNPQISLRADQIASQGSFGAIPVFAGTMLIMLLAMVIAGPLGLMTAIYLSQYAKPKLRAFAKPVLEILAGIPTVVYGFFAALTLAPLIRAAGGSLGLDVASESALAAGLMMGVMIIPFVCSLSEDVISAVPQSLQEASLGLGATKAETIKKIVLPAALPGIVGALLLAISRAIGETMIVVMAAGLAANLTINPLQAVTTVTVQIVTLLVGDQAFDSAKTLAAFALGLVLFLLTLLLNIIAQKVVKHYREQYD